jgi:uncharacterized protein DUF4288
MSKGRSTLIFGLDAFGLTTTALRRLGARLVVVEIEIDIPPYVYPSRSELCRLLRMAPHQRRDLVRQWRKRKHAMLCKELPVAETTVLRFNRAPIGVRFTLPADRVDRLRRLRNASVIRIISVEGVKEKKQPSTPTRLYAVKGRVAFQIEGQTHGTQLCEERITVVAARSEPEARARVAGIMAGEHSPYLATSGHFLRWKFEGVSDVCECPDGQFDPKATEVYSRYRRRRVRPEYEWHPAPNKRLERTGGRAQRRTERSRPAVR